MKEAIRFLKRRLQRSEGSLERWERGQALIIVVFAVFGLLVLVGLAVDLGLYYIERVRIVRAVDAATLAAAYELPLEDSAHVQAIDYLQQNGYDALAADTALIVDGVRISAPTSGVTRTIIYLDTAMFQDPPESPDTAYRIQVRVRQVVPVVFLQFAGFGNLFTEASAVAENINNLDVVIVFDQSGSMEFNTVCYGCWEPDDGGYPSGDLYPLPWQGPADGLPQHCGPTQVYNSGGHDYYFIEAEEYSYTNVPADRDFAGSGRTFWALQRSPSSASARRRSDDGKGAYIMHMPYPDRETVAGGAGETCRYEEIDGNRDLSVGSDEGKCYSGAPGGPYEAPRVDYNFTPVVDRPGGYYIWVRGQAAGNWTRTSLDPPDKLDTRIFWGIDGVLGGPQHRNGNCGVGCEPDFNRGTGYDGANNNWGWRRLNDDGPIYWPTDGSGRPRSANLNIWAGGAEFALDRIVITSNPSADYHGILPLRDNSGRGTERWADGRDGWACDPCDGRFAGYPADDPDRPVGFDPSAPVDYFPVCDRGPSPDRRTDDIYDDEQPMRASVEAAKLFVRELLDPAVDQVGYVRYSNRDETEIASELQCIRQLGRERCTKDEIENTVIEALDGTRAGGGTNIGGGMLLGLEVLSSRSGHYGRPAATHVMIVMTDGQANVTPNTECGSDPGRQWLDGAGTRAQDCVIYYAYEARDNNVIVYTITLGTGADAELMQAVADLTGGVYRPADRPEKLPAIFEELYELMYLRLVE